ncbi:MAG: hypothetical protein OXU61_09325, partial [Gammaproteobacteria bacterium]|nr:hypothetical protein [Gammaproteobacteria bacterium]
EAGEEFGEDADDAVPDSPVAAPDIPDAPPGGLPTDVPAAGEPPGDVPLLPEETAPLDSR